MLSFSPLKKEMEKKKKVVHILHVVMTVASPGTIQKLNGEDLLACS